MKYLFLTAFIGFTLVGCGHNKPDPAVEAAKEEERIAKAVKEANAPGINLVAGTYKTSKLSCSGVDKTSTLPLDMTFVFMADGTYTEDAKAVGACAKKPCSSKIAGTYTIAAKNFTIAQTSATDEDGKAMTPATTPKTLVIADYDATAGKLTLSDDQNDNMCKGPMVWVLSKLGSD